MHALLMIPWFRWEAMSLTFGGREVDLYPFQLAVALALIVGLTAAVLFARKHGRSVERTLDLAVHVLLFSFPVSYLLNGILYAPDTFARLLKDPTDFANFRLGWTMYGGILGAILGAWVWKWRRKGSILGVGDAFAFAGPFGWCVARIGCFGVHDHPGRVSDFILAVSDYQVGAPPFASRHDLGLYDALVLASIAIVFFVLSRSPRKPGFYVGLLPILHAPTRFALDFLRAPLAEGGDIRYAALTPAQYISIGLFIAGALVMRRVQSSSAEPS